MTARVEPDREVRGAFLVRSGSTQQLPGQYEP